MINIIDREAFRAHFNTVDPGLGDEDSPLWIPEHFEPRAQPSQWFVCVETGDWDKTEFWSWCRQHCGGSVLCYSASEAGDWWGFEQREDILLWIIRWAK